MTPWSRWQPNGGLTLGGMDPTPDEIRNVFISHVHEDDAALPQLKQLVARKGLALRDGSITSEDPNSAENSDYIKSSILAPRIQWASVLVVLVSPETKSSPWVDWEIEYAQKNDKRIVGVWAQGAKDSDLPEALEQYADAVAGWNGERVIDAITGEVNDWVNAEGKPRAARAIARYSC